MKGQTMNKDKAKGKTNKVVGETRERTGRAVGNDELEAKGQVQVSKGKGQSAVGDLKEKAGDVKAKVKTTVKG
jgi:uncharacterized protein YjbJ (UPF0337 family)